MKNLFKLRTPKLQTRVTYQSANKKKIIKSISDFNMEIANILINSYGPKGSNTVIFKAEEPVITKDGYSILKEYRTNDPFEVSILNLIKNISGQLANVVGDGSTSSIIASSFIFENLKNLVLESELFSTYPKLIISVLDAIEKDIRVFIKDQLTLQITNENYKQFVPKIAKLANNNDVEIGNAVADIIAKLPFNTTIKVDTNIENNSPSILLDVKNGFTYSKGLSNGFYLTNNKPIRNLKNVSVLMVNSIINPSEIDNILKLMQDNAIFNLVLVTPEITAECEAKLTSIFLKDNIHIYLVKASGIFTSEMLLNEFYDLAIYTGSKVHVNAELLSPNFIGKVDYINADIKEITFAKPTDILNNDVEYVSYLKELEDDLNKIPVENKVSRGFIRTRINKLHGIKATILVGGRTEAEKEAKKYLVEDSVLSIQTAIKSGITFASNITPAIALTQIKTIMKSIYDIDPNNEDKHFKKDFVNQLNESVNINNISNIINDTYNYSLNKIYTRSYYENEVFKVVDCLLKAYITVNAAVTKPNEVINYYNNKNSLLGKVYNKPTKEFLEVIKIPMQSAKSLANPTVYNVITNEFESIQDTNIIAPVSTDLSILATSFSIVGMLLSMNQYMA